MSICQVLFSEISIFLQRITSGYFLALSCRSGQRMRDLISSRCCRDFLCSLLRPKWILPRAKKCPPDTFTSPTARPSFRIPIRWYKNDQPRMWLVIFGRGWGIRFSHCVAGPLPGQQQSTGLLHLDWFESLLFFFAKIKTPPKRVVFLFWQRMRDSNPRKRSQSPVCYRYTNPLCLADNMVIIRNYFKKSSAFFIFSKKFFGEETSPPKYCF